MLSRRDECAAKHARLVQYLQAHSLDAVVLSRRCHFAWYTAGGLNHVSTAAEPGVASLLITPDRVVCVTNTIEASRMRDEELAGLEIEVLAAAWHDSADVARVWSDAIGSARVACDVRVPGLPQRVEELPPDFARLRWVMTEGEIKRYRVLGHEVAECLEASCRCARPRMTEYELAGHLAASLMARGIRAPVILVAADERIERYRHPLPTAKRFTGYGMLVAGGERHGLHVSATRLFSFGPVRDDLGRRHEAVCRVDAAMIAATRPGVTLGEVLAVAQKTYAETGYPGEWTCHHQGGSTGYLAREVKATPGDATLIEADQVFAWNPSIAGTKSEDTILVGPQANEILSVTGHWPTTAYEAGGHTWPRCDILEM